MLGNWSLGDYFKKEQIPFFFEFLTSELGLDPQKLFVTVFEGNSIIPKDSESIEIWKSLFKEKGIDAKVGERIFEYGDTKNWWSAYLLVWRRWH
jgi:alanyl-tRNA synthetase